MTILHAIILGLIEGLTEFLPVSSTAHLLICGELMGLDPKGFFGSFEIAIQPGAILAVVVLYWKRFLVDRGTLLRVVVAFLPTALIGATVYKYVREVLSESTPIILTALIVGGVFMILFERFRSKSEESSEDMPLTYVQAALIGLIQTLAFVPGVSRAAATILGGMALGLNRKTAVEFSFLLAVPTMLAATAKTIWEEGAAFQQHQWILLTVGFVTSFAVAVLAIHLLLRYIRTHDFTAFGIYRILFAGAVAGSLYFY